MSDNSITLEEAQELVGKMDSPASWRDYSKRTTSERMAYGIVILSRVMAGQSLRTIEKDLGIPRATVARYRDLALSSIATPMIEEARTLELERLDTLIEAVWSSAATGDEKAIASYIKLSDKRVALLGLNKPIQVESTVTEVTAQERELQMMLEQAERDALMEASKIRESHDA